MAATRLSDVIIPEVFADYVVNKTAELSAFVQAGVAVSDPLIAARAAGGGSFINLPFFNDLTGDDETITDTTDLALNAITAGDDVCAKVFRGTTFASVDLVKQLAGANPLEALGNRVAEFWKLKEQKAMISVLQGAFDTVLAGTHVNDISGGTGNAAKFSAAAVLDTKQLLGDSADSLTAIVMHSAMYTELQKANLVQYLPVTQVETRIPTYLGYRVIVDDGMPVVGGVYTTYLLAAGALVHQEIEQPNSVETQRLGTKGQDILISRAAFITHLRGVKWATTTANPTNAQLADGSNWAKVYQDKQIRAVALLSK